MGRGGGAEQVPTCRVGLPQVTERKDKLRRPGNSQVSVLASWTLNAVRSVLLPNDSPVSVCVFVQA